LKERFFNRHFHKISQFQTIHCRNAGE